jgi:hypothetical protein
MDERLKRLAAAHAANPYDIELHAQLIRNAYRAGLIPRENVGLASLIRVPVIVQVFPDIVKSTYMIWENEKLINYTIQDTLKIIQRPLFEHKLRLILLKNFCECAVKYVCVFSIRYNVGLIEKMVSIRKIVNFACHLDRHAKVKVSENALRSEWAAACAPLLLGEFA